MRLDVGKLAAEIAENARAGFERVHLSGNLKDGIEARSTTDGALVRIPAVRYDIARYRKDKTLVFLPAEGSYAEAVNVTGGFSRTHVGYVEEAIIGGIRQWCSEMGVKYTEEYR